MGRFYQKQVSENVILFEHYIHIYNTSFRHTRPMSDATPRPRKRIKRFLDTPFGWLPNEIVLHIFQYLAADGPAGTAALPYVSSRWHKLFQAGKFKKLERVDACAAFARLGSLSLVKLACRRCPLDFETCLRAAEGGHLDILEWMHAGGLTFNAWTRNTMATSSHLSVLQWLHSKGYPFHASAYHSAAKKGLWEVLKWLQSIKCPWNEWTCAEAAKAGHLDVLQWLRANGCPWDSRTPFWARKEQRTEVLQWLRDNHPEWDRYTQ